MKDQLVMAVNGNVAIAVPLFRQHHQESLGKMKGYRITLTSAKPMAYIIDCGPGFGNPQLMNAKFVEKNLKFLGDL